MNKILLLFLLFFAVPVYAFNPLMVCSGAVASGGVCTIGSGDNWVNADSGVCYCTSKTINLNFQEVANSVSKDICKIVLTLNSATGQNDTTVILKDSSNTTTHGTSDTVEIGYDTDPHQYAYTFSPPVTVSSDFNVVFSNLDIQNRIHCANTADKDRYFGGSDYKATTGGTERGRDWTMEIWSE